MDRADEQRPGVPGWVKLMALAAAILVVLVVAVMVVSGGQHGPGRHGGSGAPAGSPEPVVARA